MRLSSCEFNKNVDSTFVKPLISSTGIFLAIANNIVWVKNIDFSFMPKIIRISRYMKIFCKCPTLNISKLNF